jgi:UPF0755 protein
MSEQAEQAVQQGGGAIRRITRFVIFFVSIAVIVAVIAFLVIRSESRRAGGSEQGEVRFTFEKNEEISSLAGRLEESGLIRSEYAFLYFLWSEDAWKRLQAGEYLLSGTMTIPEIVGKLSRGETVQKGIKVTFPEGWTAAEMADRLSKSGLPGEDFLTLVRKPKPEWRSEYPFLRDIPEGASLEGVLFPDTYFFSPELGAESIIVKMLANFEERMQVVQDFSRKRGQSWYEALVLASIIEAEVKTENDRGMVADLFLRRIAAGMPLQSDATVRYVLGVTKVQHSLDDIAVDSPYNTYKYKGLPPGPIGNPGIVSMRASVSPQVNPYWYFLNNPETGATVFSITFEEHVANKAKNGL